MLRFLRCTFHDNTAHESGGALLFLAHAGGASLDDCVFEANRGQEGGALRITSSSPAAYPVTIVRSIFRANIGDEEGGAISAFMTTVSIRYAQFVANCALSDGAALSADESVITSLHSVFRDNMADKNGGALFLDECSLTMDNCTLRGNRAPCGMGGAINFQSSYPESLLLVRNSTFVANRADLAAGIYSSAAIEIVRSRFTAHEARGSGGALLLEHVSHAKIDRTLFSDNRAGSDGGALLFRFCNATANRVEICNNSAVRDGGGVNLLSTQLLLSSALVAHNHAKQGGGLALLSWSKLQCRGSAFHNNTASMSGGGIYATGSEANVAGSSIAGNTAPSGDDCVCATSAIFHFDAKSVPQGWFLCRYCASKEYCSPPRLTSIAPARGPSGEPVALQGDFFEQPTCFFGKDRVQPTNWTRSCVQCQITRVSSSQPISAVVRNMDGLESKEVVRYTAVIPIDWVIPVTVGMASLVVVVAVGGTILCCVLRHMRKKLSRSVEMHYVESAFDGAQQEFGQLEFSQRLGAGTAGEVYRARLRGEVVAVKKLFHGIDAAQVDDFRKETEILKRLDHPNVVKFYGASCEKPFLIVTEYISRGDLYHFLQSSADIPWSKRLGFAANIAEGMRYLHSLRPPILHCDLKSVNILVAEDWSLKIADFGLSKSYLQKGHVTLRGGGTPAYMAPETLRGRHEPASDVYSFGIILWELVTRSVPYEDRSTMSPVDLLRLCSDGLRPPVPKYVAPLAGTVASSGTKVPRWYHKLIVACWDSHPERRPPFAHIVRALNEGARHQQHPKGTRVALTTNPIMDNSRRRGSHTHRHATEAHTSSPLTH
eukprot:gnl/Trimastix_PCT/42.p1 GENE.gnl/Trimastix_PCT/42~~gnl/Trimastix_PCT/42.p1  ORF type:complete len:829 (+),score=231.01 gnl/Trimastix_PCT/42:2447-4933(+)